MNNNFLPYNFDYDYELKTYSHIGKDYGDNHTANRGFISNISRSFRQIWNKTEKHYKKCDNYTEWKYYILNKYKSSESENFLRYLMQEENYAIRQIDVFRSSYIPLVLCITTIFFTLNTSFNTINITYNYEIISFTIAIVGIILCVPFSIEMMLIHEKKQFYKDCIELFANSQNNKESNH